MPLPTPSPPLPSPELCVPPQGPGRPSLKPETGLALRAMRPSEPQTTQRGQGRSQEAAGRAHPEEGQGQGGCYFWRKEKRLWIWEQQLSGRSKGVGYREGVQEGRQRGWAGAEERERERDPLRAGDDPYFHSRHLPSQPGRASPPHPPPPGGRHPEEGKAFPRRTPGSRQPGSKELPPCSAPQGRWARGLGKGLRGGVLPRGNGFLLRTET